MINRPAALITGAVKRIGRAIALDLAANGWAVAIHTHSATENADSFVQEIKAAGGEACTISADLTNSAETETLIATAAEKLGKPISLLVNNASVFNGDTINDVTADSFNEHMQVNTLAPLLLSKAMAAQLPDDIQGNIINIIDQRVWRLNPTFLSYTASKAALWTLTQTCAQALAPKVRVNGIGPGPTLKNIYQAQEDFDKEASNVLLGHGPSVNEIAGAIRFILSSPSMTGQMIALDGGQHLAWQTPDIPDE